MSGLRTPGKGKDSKNRLLLITMHFPLPCAYEGLHLCIALQAPQLLKLVFSRELMQGKVL